MNFSIFKKKFCSTVKLYDKLADFHTVVGFSANARYFFHNENAQKLAESLSKSDQEKFPFDMKLINWKECSENFVIGMKKYLLNEDCSEEAINKGRKKMQK